MRLSPAEYVIKKIGGVRKTARAIGRGPGTVSKWQLGDGGIPSKAQKKILEYARLKRIDITAADLISGRIVSKKRA